MNCVPVRSILLATLFAISLSLHAQEKAPLEAPPKGFIGLMLGRGDFRKVGAVAPGFPAAEAGIEVGDYLLVVDGRLTATITAPEELAHILRGAPGSVVKLTLTKSQTGETVTL